MDSFYVYEHWRPDTGTCFYVGKGRGRRAYKFERSEHNSYYARIAKKLTRLGLIIEVRFAGSNMSEKEAFDLERERIELWRSYPNYGLTNSTNGGEGISGYKFASEITASRAAKIRGTKRSAESIARMSAARKGKNLGPRPPGVVAKIAAANKGRIHGPMSLEHRASIGASNKGKTIPPEVRAKISAAHTGKVQAPHTPEHRAKIAAKSKGRIHSEETKAKMRQNALNRSPEHLAKISAALKGRPLQAEHIAKLKAVIRPPHTDEQRAKIGLASKKMIRTAEHKAKISAALTASHAARKAARTAIAQELT